MSFEIAPMSKERKRCGAKTRQGKPCGRWSMPNGRCDMHGGKNPHGIAHPRFKNGEYVQARYKLTGVFGDKYREHLADLDYIALRDELALTTTQIDTLASQLVELLGKPDANARQVRMVSRQLQSQIETRRGLARTEAQRVKMAHDTLTGEAIRVFGSTVLQAVRRHVPELKTVAAIQDEVENILRSVGGARQVKEA